jgi:hypothetical protein
MCGICGTVNTQNRFMSTGAKNVKRNQRTKRNQQHDPRPKASRKRKKKKERKPQFWRDICFIPHSHNHAFLLLSFGRRDTHLRKRRRTGLRRPRRAGLWGPRRLDPRSRRSTGRSAAPYRLVRTHSSTGTGTGSSDGRGGGGSAIGEGIAMRIRVRTRALGARTQSRTAIELLLWLWLRLRRRGLHRLPPLRQTRQPRGDGAHDGAGRIVRRVLADDFDHLPAAHALLRAGEGPPARRDLRALFGLGTFADELGFCYGVVFLPGERLWRGLVESCQSIDGV